jgi:hypothetical protein
VLVRGATPTVAALALLLGGCLKHRETITVGQDGSVEMSVLVEGDAQDLGVGALVPRGPAWTPQGKDAAAWASHAPSDPIWRGPDGGARGDVQIGARGTFPSVEDLPTSYADPGDPFPDGSLQVSTSLEVRTEGGRALYVFERTYHALPGAVFLRWKVAEERVGKTLGRLERIWSEDLSVDEKKEVAAALADACLAVGDRLATDAFGAHYVQGDATLPLAERARVLAELGAAVRAFATTDRFVALLDAERAAAKQPKDGAPSPIGRFDQDFRAVLRSTLRSSLERTSLAAGEANGILRALEVGLVRSDRAQDLDDEDFEVDVALPGTVVAGNYASAEGGVARFRFRGEHLRDKDVVLRAVASLERAR